MRSRHNHRPPPGEVERVFVTGADYGEAALKEKVAGLLTAAAGGAVSAGARVLIKPNLLTAARPDQAVQTHPLVVRAAAEWVIARGAVPTVADSPAAGSFKRVLGQGGHLQAFEGLGVPLQEFRRSVPVDIGPPYGSIELAEEAVRADAVINLAKLKTHSMMLLTLGVKNLFGCVVGVRKPQWHQRNGVDRNRFARLLVQIHYAIRPAVTLVDGILAMEGQGPGKSGRPRHLGVLAAGRDAAAVDAAVCRMLGVDPERLPTHRAARALGFIAQDPVIAGDVPRIEGFRLPDQGAVLFGPKFFQGFSRRMIVQKPVVDPERCRACGECGRICPAGAVSEDGACVRYDYDRCIRCYCCVEVCPHAALSVRTPPLGSFLRRLGLLDA